MLEVGCAYLNLLKLSRASPLTLTEKPFSLTPEFPAFQLHTRPPAGVFGIIPTDAAPHLERDQFVGNYDAGRCTSILSHGVCYACPVGGSCGTPEGVGPGLCGYICGRRNTGARCGEADVGYLYRSGRRQRTYLPTVLNFVLFPTTPDSTLL